MSFVITQSGMKVGGAYGPSGRVTLRFNTEREVGGNRLVRVPCDVVVAEVDWGDGTVPERVRSATLLEHEYAVAGTYDVEVTTIGISRFTPRYSSAPFDQNVLTSADGAKELVGLIASGGWRCNPDARGMFTGTNLAVVDSSCQPTFNQVLDARTMFANTTSLEALYSGFNLPAATLTFSCFRNSGLRVWPASGVLESAQEARFTFYESALEQCLATSVAPNAYGYGFGISGIDSIFGFCPFVQGGIVDGFVMPPSDNAQGAPGTGPLARVDNWGRGALWTTPPSIQWPAAYGGGGGDGNGVMNQAFADSPNLTAIPREAMDHRLAAAAGTMVQFRRLAWNCPALTSVDLSWAPTIVFGAGFEEDAFWVCPSLESITFPAEMPFVSIRGFWFGCPLNAATLSTFLPILAAAVLANGDTGKRYQLTGNNSGGLLGLDIAVPFGGSFNAAPIQDWTPEAVAAKDAIVAAGNRVEYTTTA